ncbi:MAG: proline--tRNA ligase, partial [Bifidobacteriaceae bacterium]|nr:proline--tRNA ligase [Bifidobacteriaceae bacterium]
FEAAEDLAGQLEQLGLEVLYDDRRKVSPGVKFADSELIGIPYIVVVGRALADGLVELRTRSTGESQTVPVAEAAQAVAQLVKA